jgi:hypothetical protein
MGKIINRLNGRFVSRDRSASPASFTWTSEGGISLAKSIVTIDLTADGAQRELLLFHDIAADTDASRAQAAGWPDSLDSPGRLLGSCS